ncbi:MAG: amidohydrolase [Planctomyces sp.]|nr:amidohydrolase [Planctomyces sp.]
MPASSPRFRLPCSGLVVRTVLLTSIVGTLPSAASAGDDPALLAAVASRADVGWQHALAIWNWAEPGYQETQSSELLAGWLQAAGFRVDRGIVGIPTAFRAEFGEGRPVIAILGEYDALPGLAQAATPLREPVAGNGYGHGCGHHLFGVASAMAAIAVAERIQAGTMKGTIRFYGCPAEEGGSAKAFMVRDGAFQDVDAVLHWHPGAGNSAGTRSSLARIAVRFRFHGKSAHAGGSPEQGRSALDAVELTAHAIELLREHTPEETRIHHVITSGGAAPNIVPDFAEMYYYVRHPRSSVVRQVYDRVLKCAEAGALATETRLEIVYEGGIVELLPNSPLAHILLKHLKSQCDLDYSAEEHEFALRLCESLEAPEPLERIREVSDKSGVVGRGSTDVGDVSWVVPTGGFSTACWVPGTPGHSWQAVAAGGTTIGRKGMLLAARVLALSAAELLTTPDVLAAARSDHLRRTEKQGYQSLLLEGQQPPLDYRVPRTSANPAFE